MACHQVRQLREDERHPIGQQRRRGRTRVRTRRRDEQRDAQAQQLRVDPNRRRRGHAATEEGCDFGSCSLDAAVGLERGPPEGMAISAVDLNQVREVVVVRLLTPARARRVAFTGNTQSTLRRLASDRESKGTDTLRWHSQLVFTETLKGEILRGRHSGGIHSWRSGGTQVEDTATVTLS